MTYGMTWALIETKETNDINQQCREILKVLHNDWKRNQLEK